LYKSSLSAPPSGDAFVLVLLSLKRTQLSLIIMQALFMAGVLSEGEVRKRLHQAGLTPGVIDAMVEGWAQDSREQQQDGSKDEGVSQGQGVRAGSPCHMDNMHIV
jgi:hypothetical protein